MNQLLEIGTVRRPHGVDGELAVELLSDRPERVESGAQWSLRGEWFTVVSARRHHQRWLVRLDGVDDRGAAFRFTNVTVFAEPIDDPDELWVRDLIGATVVDVAGTAHGRCAAVVDNPAADLLELDNGSLVPVTFVVSVIDGTITIDPPAGLFEI